eukprot:TRINITY_DN4175_c0_g1_i1.p1 TRINITY_DN4175_c0_g1~~TRINITY_DN4175_c0_g1_i1.p1  ORF type:complete len:254 (+),score=34.22 TRINITY_DN4175_c0_g1_i1:158-919(+)
MGNKQGGTSSRGVARKASSKSQLRLGSASSSPGERSSPPEGSGLLDGDFACTPRLDESSTYRIGILGERGTGKSALFFQLTQKKFVTDHDPDEETTGRVSTKDGFDLELIDTTSSLNSKIPSSEFGTTAEKFQGLALQAITVDGCHGFILCFSLLRKETFTALQKYYEFILAVKATTWWPLVLVGTHSDMVQSNDDADSSKPPAAVTQAEIDAFCAVCHDAPYVQLGLKDGDNIGTVLRRISKCIKSCTGKSA